MTRHIVAITGLSGVGKSTLVDKLRTTIPLEHVQASTLIKEAREYAGDAIAHDRLRLVNISDNQTLLIDGFRRKTSKMEGLVILDGHTVVETESGLVHIDARVFAEIGIKGLVFIEASADVIADRRRKDAGRKRPVPNLERLEEIQADARRQADRICTILAVPLAVFSPDEILGIGATLRRLCQGEG